MNNLNVLGDGHTWKKAKFNLLSEQIGGKFLSRNSFSKKCGMLGRKSVNLLPQWLVECRGSFCVFAEVVSYNTYYIFIKQSICMLVHLNIYYLLKMSVALKLLFKNVYTAVTTLSVSIFFS